MEYYILATEEKSKIKWHEEGFMTNDNFEAFCVEANSINEAMAIVASKTSKRFLSVLHIKRINKDKSE